MIPEPDTGIDEQDQSEVFDEDNLSPDDMGASSVEMRTFEDIPDVYNATRAVGDSDEDAALIAEELDDQDLIELSADSDATDLEDDDMVARSGEAFDDDSEGLLDAEEVLLDAEGDLDARDRRPSTSASDDVPLTYAGDATNFAEGQARSAGLEADSLSDDDVEALGYGPDGGEGPASDGTAGAPVRFEIQVRNGLWVVTRDGDKVHDYSHVDRAVKETADIARKLRRTGQPADVYLTAAEGKTILVTDDPPKRSPLPEEHSAIVPDRSPSG